MLSFNGEMEIKWRKTERREAAFDWSEGEETERDGKRWIEVPRAAFSLK